MTRHREGRVWAGSANWQYGLRCIAVNGASNPLRITTPVASDEGLIEKEPHASSEEADISPVEFQSMKGSQTDLLERIRQVKRE